MNTVPWGPMPDADALKAKVKDGIERELMDAWRAELNADVRGDHVRNMLAAITEFSISLRNAAKGQRLEGTARERWELADEIQTTGRQLFSLAEEIRRNA